MPSHSRRPWIPAAIVGVTATLAARAVTPSLTAQGELGLRHDGMVVAVQADTDLQDNALGLSRAGGSATYRTPGFDGIAAGRAALELHARGELQGFGVGARLAGEMSLAPGYTVTGRNINLDISAQNPQWRLLGGITWAERLTTQEATLTTGMGVGYRFGSGQLLQNVTHQQAFTAGVEVANSVKYDAGLEYTFGDDINAFMVRPKATVAFDLLGRQTRLGGSLEGRWVGASGTRVDVGASHPDFSQRGLLLNAAVEQPLSNGITLLASASHYVGEASSTSLRVAARVPLELPLYLRPDIGSVEGRVLDVNGQGLSGVTLQAMSYLAVTDLHGTYHFPALPQGDHVFQLQAPKGQWCTPPQVVAVQGRQVVRQDFSCVPSVPTTGRLMEHPVGEAAQVPLELSGIRVSLTGPLGQFEATSDASGQLHFGDLPAGTYQLAIMPTTPTQFRNLTLEAPATVALTAGPTDLAFLFGRKPRVIQMQDEQPVMVPLTPASTDPANNPSGAP